MMSKQYEGMLLGKGLKFGVVISRFNEFFSRKLLDGAMDALLRHDVSDDDIEINVWTNAPRFGIEIESDEMLYSGATFDIQDDSFQIDFQSDIVPDC